MEQFRINVLTQLGEAVQTCTIGEVILETLTHEVRAEFKYKRKKGAYYLYLPDLGLRVEFPWDNMLDHFYLTENTEHMIWGLVVQNGKEKNE